MCVRSTDAVSTTVVPTVVVLVAPDRVGVVLQEARVPVTATQE